MNKRCFILIVIVGIFILPVITPAEATWWNTSFSKKALIEVNTSSALTNYQIRMNITYDSNMAPGFEDLRFVNASENLELNYWIAKQINSTWAEVWIMGNWTTDNGTQLYMYYGNSSPINTTANGSLTFPWLFDDFEDGVYTDWTWRAGAGSVTANSTAYGGMYSMYFNMSTNSAIAKKGTANNSFVLEAMVYFPNTLDIDSNGFYIEIGNTTAITDAMLMGHTTYKRLSIRNNGVWSQTASQFANNTWLNFQIYVNSSGGISRYFVAGNNSGNYTGNNIVNPSTLATKGIEFIANVAKRNLIDNVFMRAYSLVDPTFATGAEQSQSSCTLSNGTTAVIICSDNCTWTSLVYNVTNVTTTGSGYLTLSTSTNFTFNTFFLSYGCVIAIDSTSKFMRSPYS